MPAISAPHIDRGRLARLRILLSCLQSPRRYPIPAYDFWSGYFVGGLREAGHEVREVPGVDWAEGLTHPPGAKRDAWKARTWDGVLAFVHRETPHLFLGYLFPQQIDLAAIEELQRIGIPCVNFFCDHVREFRRVPPEFRPFALHWVPEFEALPMYAAAGLDHIHAPMPCWVAPHLRTVPQEEKIPPTFVGSADPLRRDLLGRALREGADFVVRGAGWRQETDHVAMPPQAVAARIASLLSLARAQGPAALVRHVERRLRPKRPAPLPDGKIGEPPNADEYFRVLREAMVTIGVNRVPSARASDNRPLVYSRLRDIEAPMLGACHLTEWTAGLEHLYDLGGEIETYRTAEELAAKLGELRHDPERRRRLRERGQRRALEQHSVPRSIALIGKRLGVMAAA